MKVITWNCNGALRNKFENLLDFKADIYIIQECESPKQARHEKYNEWAKNHLWIGDNKNKGLGIFAAEHLRLDPLNWSNTYKDHTVKHFLPCLINNELQLLGVWTHQNNSPNFGYIGQLWKYLQVNKHNLKKVIIAGDFNSNKIWDQWDRWWNHSDVVRDLQELGVSSLYHKHYQEEQGKESKATFFLNRKPEKPYHIDYIFGSRYFSEALTNIKIGNIEQWLKISDHLPMLCEFKED